MFQTEQVLDSLECRKVNVSKELILTASSLDCSGADTKLCDNSDKNPFMLAVEKGQLKVAKLMIEKDPNLVSLQLDSGVTVIHWALERGLDTFFKVGFSGLIIKFFWEKDS